MQLSKLLNPNKICVVGASEKEGFGGDTCRNIVKYMDLNRVFFVSPTRDKVFDVPCYKSIGDVPENFDLVIICTPKATIEGILKEAHAKGARGAVLYASGYSEVGTPECKADEESLKKICKELDMAVMGPNCGGFVNFKDDTYAFAFISEERDRRGSVGLVSQSGQICLSLLDSPNMKYSYSISSGNSSIVTMEDYMDFLVDDEGTKVVAVYLEGVKNPQKLISTFKKAAQKRKPIVVLKAGRSEKGQQIAASHTGSLAGSDKVFDAIFKKFGVIRVDDIEELLATSLMFATLESIPQKATVASMNYSGGETSVCADLGHLHGVEFPDFDQKTLTSLREKLPFYATPNNPLDMTASLSNDADGYAEVLKTVMADENIGLVAIGYTLLLDIADPCIHYMYQGIEKALRTGVKKPIVMIPFVENTRNFEYTDKLEKLGITILPSAKYGFSIIKYLMDFVNYDYAEVELDLALPEYTLEGEGEALTEHESKKLLAKYGVKTPSEKVCTTHEEAIDFANQISYPVVAKIDSLDILHKSDLGCVKVNIKNDEELRAAFDTVMNNAKTNCPNARIGGILVQQMAKAGMEVIVGVSSDPQFGPSVLCGLGGVFVEVFKDTALCACPVSKKEAVKMIQSLKASKLLNGYRGTAKLDVEALADTIVNISRFACDNKNTLKELDVNPVFVYEDGVAAVDALVINYKK